MHGAIPLLHDYVIHSACQLGGKVALVCGKQRFTYGELEARSKRNRAPLGRGWSRARRSSDDLR
jgi:non-ribosomal peptide synthetase component E (peptide arylation enzyme)